LQIAISRDIRQRCREKYGYTPTVIPKGVDFERVNANIDGSDSRKRYSNNGEKLDLTVRRLEPRRDIPTPRDFALPTLYERFGYVFLEAMACGLPIILTGVPAVRDVVGDAGILVPPRLLADDILQMMDDDELRNRMDN